MHIVCSFVASRTLSPLVLQVFYHFFTMEDATDVGSCIESFNYTEDKNATSDYHNSVVSLYVSPPLRILCTFIVILLVGIVLDAIYHTKKSPNVNTVAVEFFFVRSLLISDVIAVVVHNGFVCIVAFWSIVSSRFKGVPCTVASLSYIPYCTNSLFVILLCFDRVLFIAKHNEYIQIMTKKLRYGIVFSTWAFSFLGVIPIFLDPQLQSNTTTGICAHRPFSNKFGIVFLLLPSVISGMCAIILNAYVFYIAYKSNVAEDARKQESGVTGDLPNNRDGRQNIMSYQFVRVVWGTRQGALTALLLGGSHLLFGGIFSVFEHIIFPLFQGLTYDILKYILAMLFSFVNIIAHPLLYGIHLKMIRRNIRVCKKCFCVNDAQRNGDPQRNMI